LHLRGSNRTSTTTTLGYSSFYGWLAAHDPESPVNRPGWQAVLISESYLAVADFVQMRAATELSLGPANLCHCFGRDLIIELWHAKRSAGQRHGAWD